MNFGDLIKQKRGSLGLTLQEVADAAGTTRGHLHDLESGRHCNPGLFTCTRLAVALGLTVQAMAAAIIESQTSKDTTT
jgi:transcriptional regulator with XRE-family HTH domain